jgi:predicted hotdog family 3-hydroxylacyl-ACP dehydratase
MISARISATCPSSGIILLAPGPQAVHSGLDHAVDMGGLQGVGDLRRHVGLVMLGQHLLGIEHAVVADAALGHHALTLAEQVGQDAGVADRYRGGVVGDIETHREPVRLAFSVSLTTRPPTRKTASVGCSLAITCVGLKK